MIGPMRFLIRDERGTSLIEMALIAPVLSCLLIGLVDLSRGYAAKLKLEQAAESTIETVQQQGYTHNTTSTPTSLQVLETEAVARAGTGSSAIATAYRECRSGATKTVVDFDTDCTAGYTAARYVAIQITQTYSPMFSTRFGGSNADGSFTLVAKAAIRVQ